MLNVGLTGGIACGKSTVADMLREKGAFHIDFDRLAHQVQEPDQPTWKQIVDIFGVGILNEDRTIDREALGAVVFENREKLNKLNEIVHPAVLAAWRQQMDQIVPFRPDIVILSDVPLLIEAGLQSLVDIVVLVYISPEEQIRRLMARNSYRREEAEIRLASQMPIDEKLKYAQIVINNQGTLAQTRIIVEQVWCQLLARERKQTIGRSTYD